MLVDERDLCKITKTSTTIFQIKSRCLIKTFDKVEKISYPKIIFQKCLAKVFIGDFSKSFQGEFQEFGWDLT